MGLNKDEGRKKFLSIAEGKLVLRHQNPVEGVTETRFSEKLNRDVYEEKFTSLTAHIKNIQSKDAPFGKVWEVTMVDEEGEEYIISWPYSSRYTNNFFRALPNVDLSLPIKFAAWSMKDKKDASKTVIGLSLSQGGNKVPFMWDKDNPGELPEMVKKKVKGKEMWDDSDQLQFFEDMLKNEIIPQLNGNIKAVAAEVEEEESADDLPF